MDTTIKVEAEFKEWLRKKGSKGETYQDILKKLTGYRK